MKNDKEIKEFFHTFRPQPGGEEAFMKKLDERLAVAEQVRGYCAQERRKSRRGVIIASVVGLLCGIGLMLMLVYLPAILPDASSVVADAADSFRTAARTSLTDAAASYDYDFLRLGLLIKYRHLITALLALGILIPGGFLVARKISE